MKESLAKARECKALCKEQQNDEDKTDKRNSGGRLRLGVSYIVADSSDFVGGETFSWSYAGHITGTGTPPTLPRKNNCFMGPVPLASVSQLGYHCNPSRCVVTYAFVAPCRICWRRLSRVAARLRQPSDTRQRWISSGLFCNRENPEPVSQCGRGLWTVMFKFVFF